MAAVTDLSWQQLDTVKPGLIVVDATHGIMVKLAILTGAVAQSKDTTGVVSALYQLREIAALAQIAANQNKVIGERLNSFPQQSTSYVVNGASTCTGLITVRIPLNLTQAQGINN